MFKPDAVEAVPIVNAAIDTLLTWMPKKGRPGSDARRACGIVKANCIEYLHADALGPPLLAAFELTREAGITLPQMDTVRSVVASKSPELIGAVVVRDACIELALVEMARIIANMTFTSRLDVERVRNGVNAAYVFVEEEIADLMDSMSYRAVIGLHAAIIAHLTATARPLPQLLYFQFGSALPTLVIGQKLYANAGRADELRAENKVVHPAFEAATGRALSA